MKIDKAIELFTGQLGVEPVTAKDYNLVLRRLSKAFPDASVGELDGELVELFLSEKDISYITFNNYRRRLAVFFKFLWRKKIICTNPIDYFPPRKPNRAKGEKKPEEKSKYLPREMRRFLLERSEKWAGERDYLITALLVETGARPIEVLRIEKKWVSKEMTILFKTKNHSPRYIFYPEKLGERLLKYAESIQDSIYLFPAIKNPSRHGCYSAYKDAFEKFSVGMLQPETQMPVNPYMLRHSWFTDRAPLFTTLQLQKFGDHADAQTTQKYFHPTLQQLESMYEQTKHLAFV